MKKNKNGFTLVELLGVLVILALLVILISRPIIKMLNKTKTEISSVQEKAIVNAAEKWSVDNSDKFDAEEGNSIQMGLDIVFILDISGSMYSNKIGTAYRYAVMVDAFNIAAAELQSDINRFGVVTYSTSASIFMPLDIYSSSDGQFLKYITASPYTISTTSTLRKNGVTFNKSINVNGSTYTQGGIYTGSQVLLTNSDVSQRIPVIILLTDGAPGYCNSSTLGNYNDHSGNGVNIGEAKTGAGVCTIMAANYYKQKIKEHYNMETFFYTVGVGILNGYFGELILNPTSANINNSPTDQSSGTTIGQRKSLATWLKNNGGENNWDYADKAYINTISADDLKQAFSDIAKEAKEKTEVIKVCVSVEELYNSGYITEKTVTNTKGEVLDGYVAIQYYKGINQYSFGYATECEEEIITG